MNLNSPFLINLRSIARSIGITRLIRRLQSNSNYESAFKEAMLAQIHQSDVVWDIGANVGYYTKQFANLVTQSGMVVAFEPVSTCFEQLSKNVEDYRSFVKLYNCGLGKNEGSVNFRLGSDPLSPTGRFIDGESEYSITNTVSLPIFSADQLVDKDNLPIPNFVKIDVEGYEGEVIEGMKNILKSPCCKHIFIEMHFAILESRKQQLAPSHIVNILKDYQFKIKWIDLSHLHAYKV